MRSCAAFFCLVFVFGSVGCLRITLPTFPHRVFLELGGQNKPVEVSFYGVDQKAVGDVLVEVRVAMKKVTQMWGPLLVPTKIRLFPTHRSLEQAVHRRYRWLRAWAMFNELYLQSPRTWRKRRLKSLRKLVVHELTHVVMYQHCCGPNDWHRRGIPFWFREGMASVTASQGAWRMSRAKLRSFFSTRLGVRLWQSPQIHLRKHQQESYSMAHWMFVDLLQWCHSKSSSGIPQLVRLLRQMKRGATFPMAFQSACGLTLNAFEGRFAIKMGLTKP